MHEKSLLEHKQDYIVCTCMYVMYSDILNALAEGTTTFDAVQERFLVGTGCSSCVEEVHEIIKKWTATANRC